MEMTFLIWLGLFSKPMFLSNEMTINMNQVRKNDTVLTGSTQLHSIKLLSVPGRTDYFLYAITNTNTARRGISHSPEQRDDIAVAVAPSNAIPEPERKGNGDKLCRCR